MHFDFIKINWKGSNQLGSDCGQTGAKRGIYRLVGLIFVVSVCSLIWIFLDCDRFVVVVRVRSFRLGSCAVRARTPCVVFFRVLHCGCRGSAFFLVVCQEEAGPCVVRCLRVSARLSVGIFWVLRRWVALGPDTVCVSSGVGIHYPAAVWVVLPLFRPVAGACGVGC